MKKPYFVFSIVMICMLVISHFNSASTHMNNDNGIAYPSGTHICVNGCNHAHQNWIEFYLASGSYDDKTLHLKSSLPWLWAQMLTLGTGASRCRTQDRDGYTCIHVGISHRVLNALTSFHLVSLEDLRNTDHWWLEYGPSKLSDQNP